MKYQVLLSLKNNEEIFRMSSAAFVTGTLRVKTTIRVSGTLLA